EYAADEGRGDDDIRLRAFGVEQLALAAAIFFRELLGITAAGRGALAELDAHVLGADALDLFFDFRPDVGGDDVGAETTGGGDGLEAGDAGADDEHFGREDHPGCGGQHRKVTVQFDGR